MRKGKGRGTVAKYTRIAQCHIACAKIELAERRGVVDVQTRERGKICGRRIAKDREIQRIVLIDRVVQFKRII